MEIINNTPFEIEALPMKGPEDKAFLIIIVKGTFDIQPNQPAVVSSEQIPVAYGDEFYDEKKGGTVKFESDIVPFKPRGDIVLVGRAYAPDGKSTESVDVSLSVGDISKAIRIIGDRHWEYGGRLMPVYASDPEPFTEMELVYERSFGGIDIKGGNWCKENPIGRGFFDKKDKESLDGALLPNLEDPKSLIKYWDDHPVPVGFGFYSRMAMPRARYLGTYDEKWQNERSPNPPEDFRFDYYNGAHPDLQVEGYLKGNEEALLVNLTPDGKTGFRLPGISLSVTVAKSEEEYNYETEHTEGEESYIVMDEPSIIVEEVNLNLDTLCLIPDEKHFFLVWRGLCPINDLTAMEVREVEINII